MASKTHVKFDQASYRIFQGVAPIAEALKKAETFHHLLDMVLFESQDYLTHDGIAIFGAHNVAVRFQINDDISGVEKDPSRYMEYKFSLFDKHTLTRKPQEVNIETADFFVVDCMYEVGGVRGWDSSGPVTSERLEAAIANSKTFIRLATHNEISGKVAVIDMNNKPSGNSGFTIRVNPTNDAVIYGEALEFASFCEYAHAQVAMHYMRSIADKEVKRDRALEQLGFARGATERSAQAKC